MQDHLVVPDRLISFPEELWAGDTLLTISCVTFEIQVTGAGATVKLIELKFDLSKRRRYCIYTTFRRKRAGTRSREKFIQTAESISARLDVILFKLLFLHFALRLFSINR